MKIGHRLNISFALTIGMLALVVTLGATQLAVVSNEIELTVHQRHDGISALNQAKDSLNEQAGSMRNALLLGDPALAKTELDKVDAVGARVARQMEQINGTSLPPAARQLLQQIVSARAAFEPGLAKVVSMARSGQKDEAAALLLAQVGVSQLAYFGAIDKLVAFEVAEMRDAGTEARNTARFASNAMIVLGVLGAALSMLTAWYITRGIVLPIRRAVAAARTVASGDLSSEIQVRSTDETGQLSQALKDMNDSLVKIVSNVRTGTDTIARASSEIAAGNQDLSGRTEEQAGSLEETASSMEQLTSTVRQNADNARQANQLALSASEVAGKGGVVVSQVVQTMDSINASSRKIVDIIAVIDGIAFQTNILALNAAVEAARAGEQGRGFAVVASEVRNLAQRSAAAAKEIKGLIGDSVGQVDAGARLVDEAGRTMHEIVDSVRRVTDIMSEITAASQEQLSGIEQVNEALADMENVTQQNAALVEEAAAAATAMQDQAARLSDVVGVFTLSSAQRNSASVIPMARAVRHPAPPERAPERLRRVAVSRSKNAGPVENWDDS